MVYSLLLFFLAEVNCLESGLLPDISLNGLSFTNDNSTVFQFICSTNIAVWQCTAEFLIEGQSHTDIRYDNNTCYHTDGICSPKLCACSESCKSFTWNVTVIHDMQNHLYSCEARLVTGGVTHLANVTVRWDNTTGFQLFKKIIVPINIVSQLPTTPTGESSTDFPKYEHWIIISTAVGSITCLCVCMKMAITCRKNCYTKQNQAPQDNMEDISTIQLPNRDNHPAPKDYTNSNSFSSIPLDMYPSASQGRRSVHSKDKKRGQNLPKISQGSKSVSSNDKIRGQYHLKASQGRQKVQSTKYIPEQYHTQHFPASQGRQKVQSTKYIPEQYHTQHFPAPQGRKNEYSNDYRLEERHTHESKGRWVHNTDYFCEQNSTRVTRDSRNPNLYDNSNQQKYTPDHRLRQPKKDSNDWHQGQKNQRSKTSKSHDPVYHPSRFDPKPKKRTLNRQLLYSPVPGHTSSQSSGSEEGKQTVSNTYNISLNNNITLPGQGSEESYV